MGNLRAEIITIGDEILYGQTLDTNSHWLSGEMDKIGVKVVRKSTIGDSESEILQALAEAENRADIILITGGLGPTKDDLTKPCLVKYFNSELALNPEALEDVIAFFKSKGKELTGINRNQAFMPKMAKPIRNKNGTAPGLWLEKNGKVFISMPGVPLEMKAMMTNQVIPEFKNIFQTDVIHHKIINTVGIGESWLSEKISAWEDSLPPHIRLAYLPSSGMVKLRLTGVGESRDRLKEEIDQQVEKLLPLAGEYIFGYDNISLEEAVGNLLLTQSKTLAIAESCSGGYVAHLITCIPGSSRYFIGAITPYQNEIKVSGLGVKQETIASHGAVSAETAEQMARGVREKFNADIGIATTGIAGPSGGSEEKPVGTVWLGLSDENGELTKKLNLGTDRMTNIKLSAVYALNFLRQRLIGF